MVFIHQRDQMDCGPACLSMIAMHHGKKVRLETLRKSTYTNREGVSLLGISEAAISIGMETLPVNISTVELQNNQHEFPCILHWNQNHFVVLYKIKKKFGKLYFYIADPAFGKFKIPEDKFNNSWLDNNLGVALFLSPTKSFYEFEELDTNQSLISNLISYLSPFKGKIILMFILLLLGSCITFLFPFLTQNLIDKGVNGKNLNFIGLILLAQLALFLGSITFEVIRNWIMLYVGTKLGIKIISNFLKKMFKLPILFFETKNVGDFNQRVIDNERIEKFLTSQSLVTFFSILTFSVFFIVLGYYDYKILIVYVLLTVLSLSWSIYWLKKRRILDYFQFQQRSEHQGSIYEIINGVSEMKLNQMENLKTKKWEEIQNRLFITNRRILKIDQLQLSGFEFINQLKNIIVTFIAATLVVRGDITLGAMLSISYIIGQMNAPLNQLTAFFRSFQDAKLSMERLNEVHNHPEEEQDKLKPLKIGEKYSDNRISQGIKLNKVSFQYEGPKSPFVLKDIDLFIPEGKITAIVGASGSGKTTLMKLLLRFYDPSNGTVLYNGDDILTLSPKSIRENCGVVMQDGYIFSDTIERNIATGDEHIDRERLNHAVKVANIESFIEELPLGFSAKIGAAGNGISGGQKQRILIARAVYKNPHYILFDEATSALDAENEKIIHDNLQSFFKGKTVVIIAHRLSTVKNADQIIVLKHGKIVEQGTHHELVSLKNEYFNLVKNQLELGS